MHAAGHGWRRASVESWVVGKRARTGKGATAELTTKVRGIVFKFKELKWKSVINLLFSTACWWTNGSTNRGNPQTGCATYITCCPYWNQALCASRHSGLHTRYHCWTIMSPLLFTAGSTSCTFWSFIRSAVHVPESGWSRRGIHVTPWVNQRDVQGSKASPLTRNQCSCRETEHTENVETPRRYTWINSCECGRSSKVCLWL